jgi:hypothetical protein
MSFLKNIVSGYLGNKANKALGGISNPHARRIAGNLLGSSPIGDYIPGLRNPPRNPDQNLLFGARQLSELQLRQELQQQSEQFGSFDLSNQTASAVQKNYDWRARLRPKVGGEDAVYGTEYMDANSGTNLLEPLINSGGMIWQYTPQIFVSAGTSYETHDLQGMNYPINSYISSRPPELPIASEFTANNIDEARYMLAIFQFLKVITKSYSGDSAVARGIAGTPPPVLLFEYLGEHGFNKVPVIVKDYSIQYGEDVDYVPVHYKIGSKDTVTYVPTAALVSVNLSVNYTPQKLRKKYDLTALTTGQAYKDGFI